MVAQWALSHSARIRRAYCSVQLVARNRKCPKGLNNVPCVVWSCIKMHATYEIMNYALRLIIRATSCTLRMKSWMTYRGKSFVHQDARYAWNREWRIEVNYSCNKLHATHEIMNYALGLIIRATSCTLHMKSWITNRGLILRATSCTLRTDLIWALLQTSWWIFMVAQWALFHSVRVRRLYKSAVKNECISYRTLLLSIKKQPLMIKAAVDVISKLKNTTRLSVCFRPVAII